MSLLSDAFEVGLYAGGQGGLPVDQLAHDGELRVLPLHLRQRGPRHVVLELIAGDELMRAAGTPFLGGREGETGLSKACILRFSLKGTYYALLTFI